MTLLSLEVRAESPPASAPAGASATEFGGPGPSTATAAEPRDEGAQQPEPAPAPALLPGREPRAQPEPGPPPPAPAPASPNLATPAAEISSAAAERTDDRPKAPPQPLGQPRELTFELGAGANARLGQAAGYRDDQRWGVVYGAGLWLNVARATALGLELVHADLGRGSAQNGLNFVDVDYSLTGLWLGGRLIPWQTEALRFFVSLRLGLSLQHVSAFGTRQSGAPFETASAFDCRGTHGPVFGIAGGAGLVVRLNSRLDLVARVDAHGEQLSSDVVDGCAAGMGSATSLSAGLGIAYGFGGPAGQGEPLARARRRSQTW